MLRWSLDRRWPVHGGRVNAQAVAFRGRSFDRHNRILSSTTMRGYGARIGGFRQQSR